jgi:uncharacterized membrane protein YkvA (DUF1232 family)
MAVKKAKRKKTAAAKAKPVRRSAKKPAGSLQSRLQTEFSHAVTSAKAYIGNSERLGQLVTEAARKVTSLPKEQFKDTWAYLQAMLRLVRAYYRGEYRNVSSTTIVLIVAALIYLINPMDLLPDWLPGLGLLDDAVIIAIAVRQTRKALDEFMAWETRPA